MLNFFSKKKITHNQNTIFSNLDILEIVQKEFKLDLYGIHGINHWEKVFLNTQLLSKYYNLKSEVFELFALLHDSQRFDEYADLGHGQRAKKFTRKRYN